MSYMLQFEVHNLIYAVAFSILEIRELYEKTQL